MPIFVDEYERQCRPGVRVTGMTLDGVLKRNAR
jgi:hypothetical protein